MRSRWEEMLAAQLREAGICFERELRILKGRRFRADFAVGIPVPLEDFKWGGRPEEVLVEVNGQGPQGRHGSYGHAESDAEKLSAAACLGYRVLVVTGKQVASGEALRWIRCALGLSGDAESVFARERVKRRKVLDGHIPKDKREKIVRSSLSGRKRIARLARLNRTDSRLHLNSEGPSARYNDQVAQSRRAERAKHLKPAPH